MKILGCILVSVLMVSCYSGTLPTDNVGLPAAIAHCASTLSYWVWGIGVTCAVAFAGWRMKKAYDKEGTFSGVLLFLLLAALLMAWLYRPSDIAWNTTVEQAARGVWIGY